MSCLSRVAGYRREMTDVLLYDERRLFEAYNKGLSLLPTQELPWFRLTWDRAREKYGNGVFVEHSALVDELVGRITAEGPLSSIDFERRPPIDWHWRPTNAVRAMLEGLAEAGVLGLVRRQGNRRYYDLVERLFPPDLLADRRVTYEQRRHRLLSRFRAHGLLGRTGSAELWSGVAPAVRKPAYDGPFRGELIDDLVSDGVLVAVAVEGVRGPRYVLADEVHDLERAEGDAAAVAAGHRIGEGTLTRLDPGSAGVAFLAPLDPLVWDREFLRSLFDFDYLWEVYVPVRRRQWGYYVLPILWGDRLVGRVEPRVDRESDAIRVVGIWWESGFDPSRPAFIAALAEALDAHRAFAGVARVLLPRIASAAPLRTALRDALPALGRPAARRAATPECCRPAGVGR